MLLWYTRRLYSNPSLRSLTDPDIRLPNEDLAIVLGMQQKDLRKLCGRLREEKLLAV